MTSKVKKSIIYPILLISMFFLIVLIKNDYLLTLVYVAFIVVTLSVKRERMDLFFATFGLIGMVLGESLFLIMGVETFNRTSLFGIMPLWLPFLWSFIFISIKRVFHIYICNI